MKIFHHEKAFSQHLQYSYQWFDEEMLLKDDEEAKIKACVFFLLSSLRRVQRSNESKVIPFMRYSFPYELVYVSQSRLQHFHLAQKTHTHTFDGDVVFISSFLPSIWQREDKWYARKLKNVIYKQVSHILIISNYLGILYKQHISYMHCALNIEKVRCIGLLCVMFWNLHVPQRKIRHDGNFIITPRWVHTVPKSQCNNFVFPTIFN